MKYRVWTINFNPRDHEENSCTIITDWTTRSNCEKIIIGRYGHHPPWAIISSCKKRSYFIKRYV